VPVQQKTWRRKVTGYFWQNEKTNCFELKFIKNRIMMSEERNKIVSATRELNEYCHQ